MEKIIMNASWLASVILALVGLAKLPFAKFKEKHPKWYKATFFLLSLVLVVAGSVIVQLFLFEASIVSWQFAILLVFTGFIVFAGYSAYECTGLKQGINKLVELIKKGLSTYSDSKIAKFIEKAGGIDRITAVDAMVKADVEKKLQEKQQKEETPEIVEPKLTAKIIEDNESK